MFGWISRCWGGINNQSSFDKARARAVRPDWQLPEDQDISSKASAIFSTDKFIQRNELGNLASSSIQHIVVNSLDIGIEKQPFIFAETSLYIRPNS